MKQTILTLSAIAAAIVTALPSCESPETPEPLFELNTRTINAPSSGGSYNVTYTIENADAASITVDNAQDWVAVENIPDGNSLEVQIQENTAPESRGCTLTITCGSITESLEITQEGKEPDPVPELTIDDSNLKITYLGGEGKIRYTLKNRQPDTEFKFTTGAEWLSDFKEASSKEISFTAAANTSAAREATVKIEYGDITKELTVVQMAGDIEYFEIGLVEATSTTLHTSTTPADPDITYYTQVWPKADYDRYNRDGTYVEKTIEFIIKLCKDNGWTLSSYLEPLLMQGETTEKEEFLYPESEYVRTAFGVTEEAIILTDGYTATFETNKEPLIDISFDIEVTVSGNNASINITPSDNEQYYITGYSKKDKYDPDAIQRQVIYDSSFGIEKYIQKNAQKGTSETNLTLESGTEYIAYAVSINPENVAFNSIISTSTFRTDDIKYSDNKFSFDIKNIDLTSAQIQITTTNDDQYIYFNMPTEWYSTYGSTDEELFDFMMYYVPHICQGDSLVSIDYLEPETEYVLLVCGFLNGERTTDMARFTYTTPSPYSSASRYAIKED